MVQNGGSYNGFNQINPRLFALLLTFLCTLNPARKVVAAVAFGMGNISLYLPLIILQVISWRRMVMYLNMN